MGEHSLADFRAGFVALVGRPNVGKSSLTNALVGTKVSIVSPRQQTTRYRIHGIVNREDSQIVLVDTPGFQQSYRRVLNRMMNEVVVEVLRGVDLVLFVVEGERWRAEDAAVQELLPRAVPAFLVINKIDRVQGKARLLPFVAERSRAFPFAEVVPVSAKRGDNLLLLMELMRRYLPAQPPLFPEDWVTDRGERFLAAEFLREKLFRFLRKEVPYGVAVAIRHFEQVGELRRIWAEVVVERASQRGIVLGEGGTRLKRMASEARQELEEVLGGRVFLDVWVRVREGWTDDRRLISEWVGS
ncbi:MAG: GTPase Era [Hydrogenophilus sp.]|nr:GTPase Era [Hydrogenophilus sp.]